MTSANSVRVQFDDLRALPFDQVIDTYTLVGTIFSVPVRVIKIYNSTDASITVSYNGGVSDQDAFPAQSGTIYDYGSNKANQAGTFDQPVRQGVWVKYRSGVPTSGEVTVTVMYAGSGGPE